jgi:multidrug resistance efflux pump
MSLWNEEEESIAVMNKDKEKFYSFKLARTPDLARQLALWCGGIFLLVNMATLLPWTQNINTAGKITSLRPEDRPQTIHSTISGRIEKWMVSEGQLIHKGDTIVQLSETKEKYFDPEMLERTKQQLSSKEGSLEAMKQKAESLKKQIQVLKDGMGFSLSKAQNKVKQGELKVISDSMDLVTIRAELKIVKEQLDRQEKLYKQGLKSLTEFEQRKIKWQEVNAKAVSSENKLLSSRNDLTNYKIELNSLSAEYMDKISKAESELNSTYSYIYSGQADLSKMHNEYSSLMIRAGFYHVTAPQDGYVVRALKEGIGEIVKEGDAVVTIMPLNPDLAVELYVKPMDVPLLKVGSNVRLQFDGWPSIVFSGWPDASFGTFGGTVAVIDNIATKGKYRILVTPDPLDTKWPVQLRLGSGVNGWAMLNDVPIYYELWRQFNGFPPDYIEYQDGKSEDELKVIKEKLGD